RGFLRETSAVGFLTARQAAISGASDRHQPLRWAQSGRLCVTFATTFTVRTGFGGKPQSAARLRARIRTRPVNVCEVLGTLLNDGSWMNEVDWRLAPAELPQ
ncbi:unnamed protein product, partial [Symbiodinium necroappetens]